MGTEKDIKSFTITGELGFIDYEIADDGETWKAEIELFFLRNTDGLWTGSDIRAFHDIASGGTIGRWYGKRVKITVELLD